MSLLSLFAFASALFVTAVTPGPNIIALSARVLSGGISSMLPFLLASWVGELLWLSAAFFGLALIADSFGTIFSILKYLGAAYLLWLAWSMWHEKPDLQSADIPKSNSLWGMVGAGLAVSLGNPKIMVFYLALFPSIINLGNATLSDWAILSVVALVAMGLADMIWVISAHSARKLLRTPSAMRTVNRLGATAVGSVAVIIASR